MKYLNFFYSITLLCIILSCSESGKRLDVPPYPDEELQDKYEKNLEFKEKYPDSVINVADLNSCNATITDFYQLKEDVTVKSFFKQLETKLSKQYPDGNPEIDIFVDITENRLHDFIMDINQDSLTLNNADEVEYHFNIFPPDYSDPKVCQDKIRIEFDQDICVFSLKVFNTFMIESEWCTESMVVYYFKIQNGSIIEFERQLAG